MGLQSMFLNCDLYSLKGLKAEKGENDPGRRTVDANKNSLKNLLLCEVSVQWELKGPK